MFEKGIEAYLLLNGSDRRYFSGINTSFGCVIITPKDKVFVTDSRYTKYANSVLDKDWQVVEVAGDNFFDQIAIVFNRLGVTKVGFDESVTTLMRYDNLKKVLKDVTLVKCSKDLIKKRSIKSEGEIDKITKAQRIAEKALDKALKTVKPGIKERELKAEIIHAALVSGAESMAFETIVAFGANSAFPHHTAGDKKLKKGDAILIDFGVKHEGYCSDMTRTFFLSEVNPRMEAIYNVVLKALEYATKHISAGMTCREADSLAREYIKANGYGDNFEHSLGHGIGLDIHEHPKVSMSSDTVLEENMVITIEPGIYVQGLGGVRIEDLVIIKKDKCQVITQYTKKFKL